MGLIIEQLETVLPPDVEMDARDGSFLPPGEFREMVRRRMGVDDTELSVEVLERLVAV